MNVKMYFVMLVMGVSAWTLQSCDNDDDGLRMVSSALTNSLETRHPGANRVEWEAEMGYYVADFHEDGWEKSAWFTPDGVWQLTETEIRFTDLPAAVQTDFRNGWYASWQVEDVDKLERPEAEDVYVIGVEQGNQDVDLHYTADGILVKETGNGGSQGGVDYLPSQVPDGILSFIDERYPGARIVETDREMNGYEVDIVHEGLGKDVVFDMNGEWTYTSWEIRLSEIPETVKGAALAQYPGYRLDDADYVENSVESYYLLELESGGREVMVKVAPDGVVL